MLVRRMIEMGLINRSAMTPDYRSYSVIVNNAATNEEAERAVGMLFGSEEGKEDMSTDECDGFGRPIYHRQEAEKKPPVKSQILRKLLSALAGLSLPILIYLGARHAEILLYVIAATVVALGSIVVYVFVYMLLGGDQ